MVMTFAVKLKQLREAARLSQAQLAQRAGLHPQCVAKLEQGHREPSLATARALSRALQLSLAEFDDVLLNGDRLPPCEPVSHADEKPRRGRPRKRQPALAEFVEVGVALKDGSTRSKPGEPG
jgi:DNA-binding XRE family transcriptional regulator